MALNVFRVRRRVAAALIVVGLLAPRVVDAQPSFSMPIPFNAPRPKAIVAADLNRDGWPDLVVASPDAGTVSVMLGGPSLLQAPRTVLAGPPIAAIAVADLDADGWPDLAMVSPQAPALYLVFGSGGGAFDPPIAVPAQPAAGVAIADVDEDGLPDVVTTGGGLSIFRTTRNRTLAAPVTFPFPPDTLLALAVADFNRDGHADIAAVGLRTGVIAFGNGRSSLTFGASIPFGQSVAVADFNKDGWPDIVTAGPIPGTPGVARAIVALNAAGRSFTTAGQSVALAPASVATADFDGDGFADFAVTFGAAFGGGPVLRIAAGDGAGAVASVLDLPLSGGAAGIAVGDFTRDRKPDVAAATDFGGAIAVAINTAPFDRPIADAGPDRAVPERTTVLLDASRSTAAFGRTLTYSWVQSAGPPVQLSAPDAVNPTFVAPSVPISGVTLTFALTVSDGVDTSAVDELHIQVTNVDPIAVDAGPDQTVDEGASVTLSGSAVDPDGLPLQYQWVQIGGLPVTMSDARSATVTFSAPPASAPGMMLTFQLFATDGYLVGNDTVNVFVRHVNLPPIADAGPDQSVDELASFILDGRNSTDPEFDALTFQWTQVAGPPASISFADSATPIASAPSVPAGGATLTFVLSVSDGVATSTDTVNVIVKNVNNAPVADAGPDQTVNEGSPVTLNGSNSYDVDGETLAFHWTQSAGPSVALSDASAPQPSFAAPLVGFAGATLLFELTVSDGIATSSDIVAITIDNIDHPPIANAGLDQTVAAGTLVTLDASASTDPDGDPLFYSWQQANGTPVKFDLSSPTPSFRAPEPGDETLVFAVVVSDGFLFSEDEVRITVQSPNTPPACELAQPSTATLWPPDHKLLPISVTGVTDRDNDHLNIVITGVTQDEPTEGLGDGDTAPDAVIQGSSVLLRSERSGRGNGRIYSIAFTADDGRGGRCSGSVTVGVPPNLRPGVAAVADPQAYDATRQSRRD